MNAFVSNPLQSLVVPSGQPTAPNQLDQPMDGRPLVMVDDVTLIRLLTRRQVDAISELYDRYGRMVFSLAMNSIGDAAVAEEIVQDVFMRVWEKASTYDAGIAKVSTWLTSITRYRIIDEFRRGKRRPDKVSVSWTDLSPEDSPYSSGPEEEVELSLQNKILRKALNTLSIGEREALALAYFKGYSHSEIAEHLGIPLGTVKTRIRLAMQKLRLILAPTFFDDTQPTALMKNESFKHDQYHHLRSPAGKA
jgi:RNA polymerase sigma-70 factor (ECF subfamily)